MARVRVVAMRMFRVRVRVRVRRVIGVGHRAQKLARYGSHGSLPGLEIRLDRLQLIIDERRAARGHAR
jgi:hypothetical protein